MGSAVRSLVLRLRARREEIVREIFARVWDGVPDPGGLGDAEYVAGLRATVAAGVDFVLTGIERGPEGGSVSVPGEAMLQAHRAARAGVSVDTVMRRYMVGQALLWEYILEEAERVAPAEGGGGLRELLRAQAALVDRLVMDVAREHAGELERAGRSSEHPRVQRVRALLDGEHGGGVEDGGWGAVEAELGYRLDAEHVGVIARGRGARAALGDIAEQLGRSLLCVAQGESTVWAWLGGREEFAIADLQRVASAQRLPEGLSLAVGEPAGGLVGWRLTHRQAQAAQAVALRRPRRLTRYGDVALLAAALKDEALARALLDIYISPLGEAPGGSRVLRDTLSTYLFTERNVSSTAAKLGVVRKTVENRLCTIEARLGRSLHPCPAELEVALHLDALDAPPSVVSIDR